MQYTTTVRYENKSVVLKVTNKTLEGNFSLPEFLKAVRLSRGHSIIRVHQLTDFETPNVEAYENGVQRIPKLYLQLFTMHYKLPRKLAQLGYIPAKDLGNVLTSRLQELRQREELTQFMVAADLGIPRSTYAGYECGKNEPDLFTLVKIADYFRTSIDYLAGRIN